MAERAMFRVETRGENKGNVFIVFPDDEANPGMVQFFDPRDGHGEASIEWVQSASRPARPGEFESLKRSYEKRAGFSLSIAKRKSRSRARRDPDDRSYRTNIEGLDVTIKHHPRSQLWGATIHAKRGKGTLPGLDGRTAQEAESRTRALLRRSMAKS